MGYRQVGNRTSLLGVLATSLAILTACPGPSATLEIQEPVDGATLTRADDVNADAAGVQTNVLVQAVGVAVGGEVDLILDGSNIIGSVPVPADGVTRFEGVTIPSGTHTLTAATRGATTSPTITVTVVDDCPSISFVTPAPRAGGVTLGPSDDTAGVACGETFETTVVIATSARDGNEARIFVNGTPRVTATVSGGAARFDGVALDRRGTMANMIRVEVRDPETGTCDATFPGDVFVDCDGASCTITSPDTGSAFLSQADDVSAAPGFQGDFAVTTDADGASQPIRLVIDGNETDALSATPDGMVATFGNVPLSEGVHRVQAICTDSAGNVTRSGVAEWTVDITPCALGITSPSEGDLIITADDVDSATSGVQIAVDGTAGADCAELRVGSCSAIDAAPFGSASTDWSEEVTLSSSATQTLCAQARDAAGNVATEMVGIRFDGDGPELEIASPATGTGYNIEGNGGRTMDLATGNTTCEVAFDVYCTDVGLDVELIRDDTSGVLATTACVAEAGLPAPYAGRATFASVSLPSRNDGSSLSVYARQMGEREEGRSDAISLQPDCVAPPLTITRPLSCPAILRPSDDENTSTPELEYRTVVQNPSDPAADLTITIRPVGGGAPIYTHTNTATATTQVFNDANYGGGGDLDLIASVTDQAGNLGTATCRVTVEDLPTLNITSPTMGQVLDAGDDCGAGAGMQISVTATTDAADTATASVSVNGGAAQPATISSNVLTACVDVPEGRSVTLEVTVTEAGRGTVMGSVTVIVDSMVPTDAISDLMATVVDRRRGVARFTWTAVDDAGGFRLTSYELRCASTPITNETEWAAATAVSLMTTPGAGGASESEDVGGFRVGETRHCLIRGIDPAGALTPLPSTSSAAVAPEFLTQEVSRTGSTELGLRVAPIGDVNGDGIDDVVIGGTNQAWIYFGSATGLGGSPSVVIQGVTGARFGQRVAGIGDFNGDGRPDFAVSAYGANGFKGEAFVFFGRAASTPWPSIIDLSTGGCLADVCFVSDDGAAGGPDELAFFGFGLGPAGDFDGDGVMDLAIGASGATSFAGRAYILRGSTGLTSGTTVLVPGPAGSEPSGFVIAGDGTSWAQFGNDIRSVGGDVSGDGRGDVVIAAPGNSSGTPVPGSAAFLTGRSYVGSGLNAIALSALMRLGTGTAALYGVRVAALGDINGDSRLDAAVFDQAGPGSMSVFLGTATGLATTASFLVQNDLSGGAGDRFGSSSGDGVHPWLGRVGDVDADSITDLLVGARETGTAPGRGDLFYRTSSTTTVFRSASDVQFGPYTAEIQAAFIGDVNGDGFDDIAIGDAAFSTMAGRVIIHY